MTRDASTGPAETPWLTVKQAAAYAQVGTKTIYSEVARSRLRAARVLTHEGVST